MDDYIRRSDAIAALENDRGEWGGFLGEEYFTHGDAIEVIKNVRHATAWRFCPFCGERIPNIEHLYTFQPRKEERDEKRNDI